MTDTLDRAGYEESEALDLRYYASLARRYLALLIAVPVLFALVGYLNSDRQTRMYTATTQVLLRPNDPNERLGSSTNANTVTSNIEQYVRSQGNLARGPDVRAAAADALGIEAKELEDTVKVSALTDSNTLQISATTKDPEQSAAISDAVARAYIENRRQYARAGLERAIADMNDKLSTLAGSLPRGSDTMTAAEAAAVQQYQELTGKINELEIDLNLKNGEAELIAEAEVPTTPVSPKPARTAILAGMLGALLAAGFVLLRDRFDTRLRSREEAEALTGLATLGELPFDKSTDKHTPGIAVLREPDSPLAEAIRSLRVSLRFLSLETPLQVVLVTSALPGDGKSTTSVNLAASAAQAGQRTLLVSGDLRRPVAEKLVGTMPGPGLVELLTELAARREQASQAPSAARRRPAPAGTSPLATIPAPPATSGSQTPLFITEWCHSDEENLWVLPAGEPVANPVEIFGSVATRDFFDLAREQFDLVVVDTPPVVAVSDPIVLSTHVDGVLLVCSLRKTSRHAVQRAAELLSGGHSRLLGLVVDLVPQKKQYSGYYYTSPNAKVG